MEAPTTRRQAVRTVGTYLLAAGAVLLTGKIPRVQRTLNDRPPDPVADRRRADALQKRHGVAIGWGDPAVFFARRPTGGNVLVPNTELQPVLAGVVSSALDGVERGLDQYPAGFVAGLCGAVFVAGRLRDGGADAGGTYGPRWVLVVARPGYDGTETADFTCLAFHHELSSLLLPKLPGLGGRWSPLMPTGWRGSVGNAVALTVDASRPPDPARGFLLGYSQSSIENDFNVYAEQIMTVPETVAALARRYPVVAAKAGLVMGAYVAVDPRMRAVFGATALAAVPIATGLERMPPVVIGPGSIVRR